MSRRIKFRTWDREYKDFITRSYVGSHRGLEGTDVLRCYPLPGNFSFGEKTLEEYQERYLKFLEDRYVVQQWTGLQDKNGKEIYEGDIVKFSAVGVIAKVNGVSWVVEHADEHEPYWEVIQEVKWDDEGRWNIRKDGMGVCEVLGNIFENSELLETKEA